MHPLTVKNILTWMYELYTSHQWFKPCVSGQSICLVSAYKVEGKSWKIYHTVTKCLPLLAFYNSIQNYTALHEWCLCHTNLYLTITMTLIHLLYVFLQVVPLPLLKEDHVFCMYITAYNDRSYLNALGCTNISRSWTPAFSNLYSLI